MNKSIVYMFVVLAIVLVAIGGVVLLKQNNSNTSNNSNNSSSTNNSNTATNNNNTSNSNSSQEVIFTMAQVENANNIDRECLVVYEGVVYEIPASWKNQHPGGSNEIINSCGRDITKDFNKEHAGSRIASSQLEAFKVGKLASE